MSPLHEILRTFVKLTNRPRYFFFGMLESYAGIPFLTINRIHDCDEAATSRSLMSLH